MTKAWLSVDQWGMMDPLFHMDSMGGMDGLSGGGMMGMHSLSGHGVCDPHMNGLSLQEMIDTDIKAEFDDVLLPSEPSHGAGAFAGMDTLDGLLDADFKLDDVVGHGHGGPHGIAHSAHSSHSYGSLSYLEDFNAQGNVLVNPNNVMPVQHSQPSQPAVTATQAATPVNSLSVNTQFSQSGALASPASMSSPAGYHQQHIQQLSPIVTQQTYQSVSQQQPAMQQQQQQQRQQGQQFLVKPSIVSGVSGTGQKTVKILPPVGSNHGNLGCGIQGAATVIQSSTAVIATTQGRKKQVQKTQAEKENGYPKPGYSYSCLIALALKNSHTGHLSVSEIYKFMCEHFPYFKTAPAGWKNSVRHNLSLNKCFEKIEKPSVGGANQRKGCLWAMNPAKITKMDEEVLKWSRKDPMAIKKGMVHPHTLEKLERGEMVKDYNANTTNNGNAGVNGNGADSEDEDDPKSPTSISSQSSSQGYDSAGSDFVDIEGFASIPDSSLPELQLQASGNFGTAASIFEDLADERLQLLDSPVPHQTIQHLPPPPQTQQQPQQSQSGSHLVSGSQSSHYTTSGHQQVVRLATAGSVSSSGIAAGGRTFYPTAIHANYAIAPAQPGQPGQVKRTQPHQGQQTLVVTRQEGKVFTVGGPLTS